MRKEGFLSTCNYKEGSIPAEKLQPRVTCRSQYVHVYMSFVSNPEFYSSTRFLFGIHVETSNALKNMYLRIWETLNMMKSTQQAL